MTLPWYADIAVKWIPPTYRFVRDQTYGRVVSGRQAALDCLDSLESSTLKLQNDTLAYYMRGSSSARSSTPTPSCEATILEQSASRLRRDASATSNAIARVKKHKSLGKMLLRPARNIWHELTSPPWRESFERMTECSIRMVDILSSFSAMLDAIGRIRNELKS